MLISKAKFEEVRVEHLTAGNGLDGGAGFEDVGKGEIRRRNRGGVVMGVERNGFFEESIFYQLCYSSPHRLPAAVHCIARKNYGSSCKEGNGQRFKNRVFTTVFEISDLV